jgi:rod shape-determining protein MreC
VVTPDGIVGKVVASYPTASQVQLITDENFAAGVISDKHRVHGTLMGKGPNKPIVNYVQNEETVDQGEIFYTSGDDRVFPKGMPVGTATVVRPGKNFKDIFVSPTAFQNGLEEVLIVLEGVHQVIPDHKTEVAGEVKILPAPPSDEKVEANQDLKATLQTEADKLHDRYKKVGEAQNYKFGEGFRSPDFNANPNQAKPPPAPAVPSASCQTPAGGTAGTGAVKPPAPQPATQTPASGPVTQSVKPAVIPGSGTVPASTAAVKPPAPKPQVTSNPAVAPQSTGAGVPAAAVLKPPAAQVPKPVAPKPPISEADTGARNRAVTVALPESAKPQPSKLKPPARSKPDDGSPESLPIP